MARTATARKRSPTIDQLCARFDNENPHTEHVTRLALELFAAVPSVFERGAAEVPLLNAAARLHDVGYRINAERHPEESARLVKRLGVAGFDSHQLQEIAAIILLHSGEWKKTRAKHPAFQGLRDDDRIFKLGAVLRAADGLDHGHVQDARIQSIEPSSGEIVARISSPHFPYNATRGMIKANLWQSVMPLAVRFELSETSEIPPLLTRDLHLIEAARRALSLQYKRMVLNVEGTIRGASSQPLHDFRVALRRFRSVARLWEKPLKTTPLPGIDRELNQLSDALGSARDFDVWLDFLNSKAVQRTASGDPLWRPFLAAQSKLRQQLQREVRRQLEGRRFKTLKAHTARLLRVDLPHLARVGPARPTLRKLAEKRFARGLKQVRKCAPLRHSNNSQKLHELRITLRRARYVGELFAGILGAGVARRTKRLKRADQLLGAAHDADAALARIKRDGLLPPKAIIELLHANRDNARKKFKQAWKKCKI